MLSILIVNRDKEFIRKLSGLIADGNSACEIIGTADNGPLAMESIIRLHPDLVFIEQDLPGMTGLEIIRQIKNQSFICEFVFTEKKGDFALAQQAMRLGVREYLVRPVTSEDFERIILTFSEHSQAENSGDIDERLFSTRRLLRNSFMENFISGDNPRRHTIDELNERYHFSFRDGMYQVAFLQFRELLKEEESQFLPDVVEELRTIYDPLCYEMIPFIQDVFCLVLVFNYAADKDLHSKFTEMQQIIERNLSRHRCTWATYSIGFGAPSEDVNQLREGLDSARRAAYCCLLREENRLYFFEQLEFAPKTGKIAVSGDYSKSLYKSAVTGDFDQFETLIRQAMKSITPDSDPSTIMELCSPALEAISKACGSNEAETKEECNLALYRLMNCRSIPILINSLVSYAHSRYEAAQQSGGISRPIQNAKNYIKSNFAKGITLQDVANYVDLNASYLSVLFKKVTGQNYQEFLTDCRIAEAKRLLKSTNMSVAEICYAVGYTDKKHFSRLFIKNEGITPTAFRNMH